MKITVILILALLAACLATVDFGRTGAQSNEIAEVILVDNSDATIIGANRIGRQQLQLKILTGAQQGRIYPGQSLLTGAMEFDEYYQAGDTVLVVVDNHKQQIRVLSHFRLPLLAALFGVFAIGLLVYARGIGLRSLLSFGGSVIIIWGVLIKGILGGYPLFPVAAITCMALACLIILSVGGLTLKALSALLGTLVGLGVTSVLCLTIGAWLHLDGMSQPLAQQLYFETGMKLDLLGILYVSVIVGASGAAMDVAMEMAATIEELKLQNPSMDRTQLLRSGFKVGNAVIGTMTTTLLLAYSGSFLTLVLIFASRGADLVQVLNMKIIAAEISRTLIGSISLVMVAPITAFIASRLVCRTRQTREASVEVG